MIDYGNPTLNLKNASLCYMFTIFITQIISI